MRIKKTLFPFLKGVADYNSGKGEVSIVKGEISHPKYGVNIYNKYTLKKQ